MSTTVVKKTVRRIITSDGNEDVDENVSTERHSSVTNYQLYRGLSPTTQNRLENRVKELEVALEQERAAHIRTQTEVSSVHIEIQTLHEKLDLAEKEIENQIDVVRRRDQELLKAKKDNELLGVQYEASEASLKKRFQDQVNDLNEQLDRSSKARAKVEKEKQQLILEVEGLHIIIDEVKKAKSYVESKVESSEDLIRQLRLQVEELTKSSQELSAFRARLTQENAELHRQLQDIEAKYNSVSQSKTQIQQKLDVVQTKLEEEKRVGKQLETQLSTVTADFEKARTAVDDQSQEILQLEAQLQKFIAENQYFKTRYDKDIAVKTEEFDELRRKSTSRITELETLLEQSKTRIVRLEKEKSKIVIQLEEITFLSEEVKASLNEHVKLLKQAETTNIILQKRVDELNLEVQSSSTDVKRLQTELIQSKQTVSDQQSKIEYLTKENRKLSESVHEFEITIKDLSRQQQELSAGRSQWQLERDSLQAALNEARDTIQALELKIESSNITIHQLKIEIENVTLGRNDEIENIRKGSQRTIDELRLYISELESRIKTDSNRWKKKVESEQSEFLLQIDELNRGNAELAKVNKNLTIKLKDTETLLDAERKTVEQLTESVAVYERKLVALQTEVEEVRSQLTVAEKARKIAETEKATSKAHITEINVTIQNLTVEKRRLESDLVAYQRELDDAVSARRAAEERAEKLALELPRLSDQIRFEQSNVANAESKSRQLEAKTRELTLHIEQLELVTDGKKNIAKLQLRVSELEKDLELEKRNGRELAAEIKKLQRQLFEAKKSSEEEHRRVVEYKESVSTLEQRITTLKRQLQDSEEMVSITVAKYRKTQQLLEEAERRADKTINVVHHKSTSALSAAGGSGVSVRRRSYSITRETSNSSASRSIAY